jgi:hypothetical protein
MDLIAAFPKDIIALSTFYYDRGNRQSRHARIRRRNGLKNHQFTMNDYSLNFFTNYSSKKFPPQFADTSQLHLVTVPLGIELAYRACNNLIAHSHPVPVQSPATHANRMPTSWNSEFLQQDQIEAKRTAPIVLVYCTIYRRPHQILQCYICGIPRML